MSGAAQGPSWWRKRPVTVQGIPWTGANADAVAAFAGGDKFTSYALVRNRELEVWNEQERHWLPCPAGHVVMRGALGELYPVSPAALEVTYDPAGGPEAEGKAPGQAALRLAVITEVREAASCGSDDGDQCEKCTRHADAILAAAAAREPHAMQAELTKVQRGAQTLGMVVGRLTRDLYAMWIDVSRGDLEAVRERVLNAIPDCDDNEPGEQWNGTETGDEWFNRTREAVARASTALRSEQTGLEGSSALDGWNEETGMAR